MNIEYVKTNFKYIGKLENLYDSKIYYGQDKNKRIIIFINYNKIEAECIFENRLNGEVFEHIYTNLESDIELLEARIFRFIMVELKVKIQSKINNVKLWTIDLFKLDLHPLVYNIKTYFKYEIIDIENIYHDDFIFIVKMDKYDSRNLFKTYNGMIFPYNYHWYNYDDKKIQFNLSNDTLQYTRSLNKDLFIINRDNYRYFYYRNSMGELSSSIKFTSELNDDVWIIESMSGNMEDIKNLLKSLFDYYPDIRIQSQNVFNISSHKFWSSILPEMNYTFKKYNFITKKIIDDNNPSEYDECFIFSLKGVDYREVKWYNYDHILLLVENGKYIRKYIIEDKMIEDSEDDDLVPDGYWEKLIEWMKTKPKLEEPDFDYQDED